MVVLSSTSPAFSNDEIEMEQRAQCSAAPFCHQRVSPHAIMLASGLRERGGKFD